MSHHQARYNLAFDHHSQPVCSINRLNGRLRLGGVATFGIGTDPVMSRRLVW
ncbi:hypothetical protein [Methylocapsa palsarum]|uniref:hypothetical protein n=1 Tax=Methylocapsa palsarum TaxID=1612308 RepID=UPI001587BA32|nr:hypothetical protein [Methylocapsa palsarum]